MRRITKRIISLILMLCMSVSVIIAFPITITAETSTVSKLDRISDAGEISLSCQSEEFNETEEIDETEEVSLASDTEEPIPTEGNLTDNIKWKLEGDTLTISGTGEMPDWKSKGTPWYALKDNITNLVIVNDIKSEDDDITDLESGIINIGEYAFYFCRNIASVTLPDSIVSIGDYAFFNCENLTSIELPDNIVTIGRNVFKNCTSLSDVKLPEKLESIGYGTFRGCTSLTEIEIPKNLNVSEKSTENNKPFGVFTDSALKTVNFEEGVTLIPECLFTACKTLETITIPDTVTKINNNAFYYCTALKEVTLQENLLTINDSAFQDCTALESIVIPDSVGKIGRNVFYGCKMLSDVKLPKYLESLGYGAFRSCTSLKEIEIPKNLSTAERSGNSYGVFTGSGLTTVKFEEGITAIPKCLFALCSLKTITIPETVIAINDEAFYGSGISEVVWFDTLLEIKKSAFEGCSSFGNIILPENLTTIGDAVFKDCTAIVEIDIPDSVTSLGASVFEECHALKRIKLPAVRNNITKKLFYNCIELKDIVLPDTVINIQDSAFYGCKSLRKLEFPEGLETIQDSAFYECIALEEVIIPKNVNTIGTEAFYDCDALKKVEVKGSGTIGKKAFYDCDAMEILDISDNVTTIGANMCYGCEVLTDLKLGRSIKTIPDSAFRLCASLETVTIPRLCTTLATNAFAEDAKLTSVYVSENVTSIQANTFSYPNKMTMYGKAGSYAQEYAESRGITFDAVNIPIVSMEYVDVSINLARKETVTPELEFLPDFNTDKITYVSDNTDVVTVSDTGAIYGKNYGTANVIATSDSGVSTFITVNVIRPASTVKLDKSALEITQGNMEMLIATVTDKNSTDILEWSSDNTSVATVDVTGTVSAVGVGTANITVKAVYAGKTATCAVTVTEYTGEIVPTTDILLDCTEKRVTAGEKFILKATVLPENASNRIVEWASTDTSIAEVSGGVVTAKSVGTTKIIAKTADNTYVETCNLTVVPKAFISNLTVTPAETHNLVDLSAINVTDNAIVYLAAYNDAETLMELQLLTLTNGSVQAQLPFEGIAKVKVFIWEKDSIMPLSDCKEYKMN